MPSIKLSIADPCHEDWNKMLPEEKGRFCLSCQKTVVDFTSMSDGQVFDYFKSYKGNTCGQFTPQQLDRQITKPKTNFIGRWKYFWQILLPAVFALHKAAAQPARMGKVAPKVVCKADTVKPTTIRMGMVAPLHYEQPTYRISGQLTDKKGNPLGLATVRAGNRTFMADSSGAFSIDMKTQDELQISYVGYASKVLTVDSLHIYIRKMDVIKTTNTIVLSVTIPLSEVATETGVVVVAGYISHIRQSVGGGISVSVKRNGYSKTVVPNQNQSVLKIFPNPIQPGQDFKISLPVKKNGIYLMRITDASGKVLQEQKLSVEKTIQDATIRGAALQQAGVYFINVLNTANKNDKGLSGKILVQ